MLRKNRAGYGRTEIAIGAAVLVVIGLIAIPLMSGTTETASRAELPLNVEAIRTAEIAYQGQFGDFVSADPAPRRPEAVNGTPVPWAPTRGFKELSWSPENTEQVIGSYRISVDGKTFKVTGTSDTDSDGIRATFTATQSDAATQVSPDSAH